MPKRIILSTLLYLLGNQCFASTPSYVGPFLNFIEPGENNDKWELSALIVAPSTPSSPLSLNIDGLSTEIKPELIVSMNNRDFWRYNLSFNRTDTAYSTSYSLGKNSKAFPIFIPAKDADPHVFFGTCNQLLETPSTWDHINKTHSNNPYHIAVLGGDQLYVDMVPAGKKSVFDVETVKKIMSSGNEERMKPLTAAQEQSIDRELTENLLNQYSEQYSSPGFAEFLASVPTKCLADDHEYFNGKGSYANLLPVMKRIEIVADYFYYLFQHHTIKEKCSNSRLIGVGSGNPSSPLLSYSYFLKFKTIAIYGLDTRTERTLNQVSSPQSREFMFNHLKNLTQKNIFIITGIPLIYQNLQVVDTLLKFINKHYFLKYLYDKASGQPSVYNRLDITTDISDYWYSPSHRHERNQIIDKLDHLGRTQNSRVTLLAGDPHSASVGEVIDQQTKEVRLRQIISSAITTPAAPKWYIMFKRFLSFFQKPDVCSEYLVQRMTNFENIGTGQVSRELALNNWLDLSSVDGTVYTTLLTKDKKGIIQAWSPQG